MTGLIFGVPGVIGLLVGGLSAGFVLAIFMANAGGAWDNAKKYIEEGNFGVVKVTKYIKPPLLVILLETPIQRYIWTKT